MQKPLEPLLSPKTGLGYPNTTQANKRLPNDAYASQRGIGITNEQLEQLRQGKDVTLTIPLTADERREVARTRRYR